MTPPDGRIHRVAAVLLLVAKAPVPGTVKTRLAARIGMRPAAEIAAAALLDTVATASAVYGAAACHLALSGNLRASVRSEDLYSAIDGWAVHPQRGRDFAARLAHAHRDVAAATGAPVVQIGMDTPQIDAVALRDAANGLATAYDAVIGPAQDGGWWLLGVGSPALVADLATVPMSTPSTFAATTQTLRRAGGRVRTLATMRDVDNVEDAEAVARAAPHTRFAQSWYAPAESTP